MKLRIRIYKKLVNQIPEIQIQYHRYRDGLKGVGRGKAWIYLIILNVRYRLVKGNKDFSLHAFDPDENKKLYRTCESELSAREHPRNFAEKLKQYDVISFDVFDTLIFRIFNKPADVFFLVSEELNYLNFEYIRQRTEEKARRILEENEAGNEIRFREIWELLETESGIPAEIGMEAEWKAEQKSCYANPFFLEVFRYLKDYTGKIIVTSDMYLNSEQIRELLKKAGYPDFDAVYVSGEYRKSKSNGTLYEALRNQYGKECRMVHIGDNAHADKRMAEKYHISGILYPNVNSIGDKYRSEDMSAIVGSCYRGIVNAHLHNCLRSYSAPYEFGFVYGGLFVVGYCRFIHEYVHKHQSDCLLFLARDGDILYQVYTSMYPEETEKCRYVFWSRLAAAKMTAGYYKYDYFRRFLFHKVNQDYTLQQIFHSMELDDMLSDYLTETDTDVHRKGMQTVLTESEAEAVRRYLNAHWERVLKHYEEQIANGRTYFGEILKNRRNAVAIDVGWAGSGAIALDYLINQKWNLSCSITGIVAGTNGANTPDANVSEGQLESGKIVSYLFSQRENRDLWKAHNPSVGHNVIVESLLASEHPSFRSFMKGDEGEYIFGEKEEFPAEQIQKGIRDFAKIFNEKCDFIKCISGRDCMAPIMMLYKDASWLRQIINEENILWNVE